MQKAPRARKWTLARAALCQSVCAQCEHDCVRNEEAGNLSGHAESRTGPRCSIGDCLQRAEIDHQLTIVLTGYFVSRIMVLAVISSN
eukprot:2600832-Pleurochrysis_carterae.AAC.1